ncbi:MAG: ATP synthase F1 subunit epsilon [Phycisphaerales bacterium]
MADKTFRCTVITPNKQVLDKDVTAAVIPAWDGEIGLLKQRAPILCKLGFGTMRLDAAGGGSERLFIGGGFAQMKGDRLTLLTDEAKPVSEIDVTEVQAALKEAEAFSPKDPVQSERRRRDLERAKAMLKAAGH